HRPREPRGGAATANGSRPPRLLGRLRGAIRARPYIFFHGKRHPAEMGAGEITKFLTSFGGGWTGRRVDPEPGAQRASLPVPRSPRPGRAVARRDDLCETSAPPARRHDARGGRCGPPRDARCHTADGVPALRVGTPSSGV